MTLMAPASGSNRSRAWTSCSLPLRAAAGHKDVNQGMSANSRSITARKSRQWPNLQAALRERASFLRGLASWRGVQAHHLMALRLFEGAQYGLPAGRCAFLAPRHAGPPSAVLSHPPSWRPHDDGLDARFARIVRQTESRENHWRIPSHNPLSKSSPKAIVMGMAR